MGFISGLLKRLIKWTIYLTLFITIIVLIPNLPPYTKFTKIVHEPIQHRVGPLAPNGALNNIEKLYVDKVLGPETFQIHNGEMYTSLATGEIVKISPGGHVTFVTTVGQPCNGLVQEDICGRILGFKIDEKNNQLYVADAYYGIWKIDLKTDRKQLLVSPKVEIDGRKPKFFNDVALAKNGDLYWTDSSSDFDLKNGVFSLFTDPSGRLFHYNAAKNESKVLLDNLWFANGVTVSPDNQFVVVSETCRYRLLKYYIDGAKKGKSEVFVAGLPGTPDNVRSLPDGSGVLVGLYTVFDDEHPLLTRSFSQIPALRKFLARIQRLVEISFEFLNSQYPHPIFEDIIYHIGHFKSASALIPPFSGLVQVDWNGNIVASYFNTDRSLTHISDAILYNNKLYLGRPHEQNFIGAVSPPPLLKKAFTPARSTPSQTASKEVPMPKVEIKPQEAKPVDSPKPKKEEKKETPIPPKLSQEQTKSTPQKPVKQESKPAQQKPADTVKTTTVKPITQTTQPPKTAATKPTTPASAEKKSTASKPAETKPSIPATTSKQAETKQSTPKLVGSNPSIPKTTETKPTAPKQAEADPTAPKQSEAKPTTLPKQAETKPAQVKTEAKPAAKQTDKQHDIKTKKTETSQKTKTESKPVPEQIPIKEEIPSDTTKPTKDTLKVIKKNGPTEIPNPNI